MKKIKLNIIFYVEIVDVAHSFPEVHHHHNNKAFYSQASWGARDETHKNQQQKKEVTEDKRKEKDGKGKINWQKVMVKKVNVISHVQ